MTSPFGTHLALPALPAQLSIYRGIIPGELLAARLRH
jgi:hypothetical protein